MTLPSAWSWAMRAVWGGVGARVLVGQVGSDLGHDVVADALGHAVAVGEQRAEVVVEGFEDVAQAVPLRRGLVATT